MRDSSEARDSPGAREDDEIENEEEEREEEMEKSDHFPLLTLGSMMTKRWRRKWGEGCQKTIRNRLSSQIPWKLLAVFFFPKPSA